MYKGIQTDADSYGFNTTFKPFFCTPGFVNSTCYENPTD